jgi:hypothetical protein
MGAQHIITYDKMAKHLDWRNREPTYFISFYISRAAACAEAQRRRRHWNVGGNSRQPDSVRVATVSAQALDHAKVFYFSNEELIKMLVLPSNHPIRSSLGREEWFVMEFAPRETVVSDVSARHSQPYAQRHNLWPISGSDLQRKYFGIGAPLELRNIDDPANFSQFYWFLYLESTGPNTAMGGHQELTLHAGRRFDWFDSPYLL